MPLSRYQIRSEYSLANPDLYRAADKDDPEGLLEGVAMAGLVGIIRQLGDLADFAAEVFHDLHEDVSATAARSHELVLRVRQLEREVPLIETMMFSDINCGNFMYNPGMEWHVHIHNGQNHFTQGDLPRFIRSAYEECKSPPRLFVLDRFDGTGAGTCLKRFTDPSFFKMEWASSELMKAEKEQRDHKARRLKRKGQQQGNGAVREARLASHTIFRVPIEAKSAASSSIPSSSSNSSGVEQEAVDLLKQENEDMLTASSSLFSGQEGSQLKGPAMENVEALSLDPTHLQQEPSTIDSGKDLGLLNGGLENGLKEAEVLADDSASETDNFMDAVTTMDSEVETDTEAKPRDQGGVDFFVNGTENDTIQPQLTSEDSRGAGAEQVLVENAIEQVLVEDPIELKIGGKVEDSDVVGEDCSTAVLIPEELYEAENFFLVDDASTVFQEQEDLSSISNQDPAFPAQMINASPPKSPSGTSSSGVEEDAIAKFPVVSFPAQTIDASPLKSPSGASSSSSGVEEDAVTKFPVVTFPAQTVDTSPPKSPSGAPSSGVEGDAVAKLTGLSIDNISRVSAEGASFVFLDGSVTVPCSEKNGVSTSINQSSASSPVLEEKVFISSGRCLLPEGNERAFTSLETLEASDADKICRKGFSDQFNQLDMDVLGSQREFPRVLGTASTRKRWQISQRFDNAILAPDLNSDGSQASESEEGDSPKKPSSHSSPRSSIHSIQPMRWAIGSSKFYHTDDEVDGLQDSSGSLSSSSTLSSPRPSMLATTLQKMNIAGEPEPSPLPHRSADSSPTKKAFITGLHERVSHVKMPSESVVSPASEHSVHSSPHSRSSPVQPFFDSLPSLGPNLTMSSPEEKAETLSTQNAYVNNLEAFPPPPPLPPLAWRMSKRSPSAVVGPSVPRELPTPMPCEGNAEVRAHGAPRISTPSTTVSVLLNAGVRHVPDDSMQSVMHEKLPSEIQPSCEKSGKIITDTKPAGSERSRTLTFTAIAETSQEESVSAVSSFERDNIVTARPACQLPEKLLDNSNPTLLTKVPRTESIPARLDNKLILESGTKGGYGVWPLASQGFSSNFEGKESSAEATTSSDINRLRRRSQWALTSSTASSDDREVLLEQIRTRSFSLRNSNAEKLAAPRPVVNINVAAILEKANAIRQAFAGSDEDGEDDEWSDA